MLSPGPRVELRTSAVPKKGRIEIRGGLEAFFVPGKSGLHAGRDENVPVKFYLGFSYDGPRAWAVQRIKA